MLPGNRIVDKLPAFIVLDRAIERGIIDMKSADSILHDSDDLHSEWLGKRVVDEYIRSFALGPPFAI